MGGAEGGAAGGAGAVGGAVGGAGGAGGAAGAGPTAAPGARALFLGDVQLGERRQCFQRLGGLVEARNDV